VSGDRWSVSGGRRRLTTLALVAMSLVACHRAPRSDSAELVLAAAASESLTVALADSLAPAQGFVVGQAGSTVGSLSACDDRLDSNGWQSFGSSIVEMELPPGFNSEGQSHTSASWRGPAGSVTASAHRGDAHSTWMGSITSECDVYISGWPAHVDLVTTSYGRSVRVLIKPNDAPPIGLEGQTRSIEGQAQLLHAFRRARISSAWGR